MSPTASLDKRLARLVGERAEGRANCLWCLLRACAFPGRSVTLSGFSTRRSRPLSVWEIAEAHTPRGKQEENDPLHPDGEQAGSYRTPGWRCALSRILLVPAAFAAASLTPMSCIYSFAHCVCTGPDATGHLFQVPDGGAAHGATIFAVRGTADLLDMMLPPASSTAPARVALRWAAVCAVAALTLALGVRPYSRALKIVMQFLCRQWSRRSSANASAATPCSAPS